MPTYVTTHTTTTTYSSGGNRGFSNIRFNSGYISTNRGLIKILQIICGIIIASFLITHWWDGRKTFSDFRPGFASSLNSVCIIVNIVLLIFGLLNIGWWKAERMYGIIGFFLFLLATIFVAWFIYAYNAQQWRMIASAVLLGVEAILYLWDVKILQGESPN